MCKYPRPRFLILFLYIWISNLLFPPRHRWSGDYRPLDIVQYLVCIFFSRIQFRKTFVCVVFSYLSNKFDFVDYNSYFDLNISWLWFHDSSWLGLVFGKKSLMLQDVKNALGTNFIFLFKVVSSFLFQFLHWQELEKFRVELVGSRNETSWRLFDFSMFRRILMVKHGKMDGITSFFTCSWSFYGDINRKNVWNTTKDCLILSTFMILMLKHEFFFGWW